jgi:hypothetical protein
VESPVSWVALVAGLNLAINSLTLLFVVAQSLRLTSYLTTAEWQEAMRRRERNSDKP